MNSKMLGKPKLFQPFHDFIGDGLFTTMSGKCCRNNMFENFQGFRPSEISIAHEMNLCMGLNHLQS